MNCLLVDLFIHLKGGCGYIKGFTQDLKPLNAAGGRTRTFFWCGDGMKGLMMSPLTSCGCVWIYLYINTQGFGIRWCAVLHFEGTADRKTQHCTRLVSEMCSLLCLIPWMALCLKPETIDVWSKIRGVFAGWSPAGWTASGLGPCRSHNQSGAGGFNFAPARAQSWHMKPGKFSRPCAPALAESWASLH